MQTESVMASETTSAEAPPVTGDAKAVYFGWRDLLFVVAALATAITVARLGMSTWVDGNRTETVKAQGEAVAAWMTEQGKHREAGQATDLAFCSLADVRWSECRDAMVAANGPFADMRNQFSSDGPIFSSSCDRTRLETQGSLILEKGTPKPPDGSSLLYSPLADDEPLIEPLSLRVSICGRGFAVIHVAEFKF
ncbi:MAG: hypothetical protein EBV64_11625 [Oxalobacteraceae bacterium]|nr:hypothetical protein [Oxalobacteraceae bacterium]